ncbi:MAG: dimethylarginine dimethylaminohydrolase family protein [Oligoflexus sp.]|jgi:N-dimethylarginine dimethylaminohydrolase
MVQNSRDESLRAVKTGLVPSQTGSLVFMVDPEGFDVVAAINPHMKQEDGTLNAIDRSQARLQWEALRRVYEQLGLDVTVLAAVPHCPDMVFCANQTLPFIDHDGQPAVILSNMADDTRHQEVAALRWQLESRGVRCYQLPDRNRNTFFEGMGDALWVPGRRLICGGYGSRTHASIYKIIQKITGAEIELFELPHPKFYHLDTCLSILDDQTALACRTGFTEAGWQRLSLLFPRLIEVPLEEADAPGFACNAHCPDQHHVILQAGSGHTVAALKAYGYEPIEVDTGEYIKSGGSVFCMKMLCPWPAWPSKVASGSILGKTEGQTCSF